MGRPGAGVDPGSGPHLFAVTFLIAVALILTPSQVSAQLGSNSNVNYRLPQQYFYPEVSLWILSTEEIHGKQT